MSGRVRASLDGFDEIAARLPDSVPQLWQRGIAQYYDGRYKECARQFAAHRTVNPTDVENVAWHFVCVARAESPGKARVSAHDRAGLPHSDARTLRPPARADDPESRAGRRDGDEETGS